MVRAEAILKYIEIESTKAHLEGEKSGSAGLKDEDWIAGDRAEGKRKGTEKLSGSSDRGQFQTESQ